MGNVTVEDLGHRDAGPPVDLLCRLVRSLQRSQRQIELASALILLEGSRLAKIAERRVHRLEQLLGSAVTLGEEWDHVTGTQTQTQQVRSEDVFRTQLTAVIRWPSVVRPKRIHASC
ncbi:hypothetical protein CFK39_04945 [Brachybacterium avium]|uniref:Uncharacterized protein n=1 Tax=Brachybacterium avium TaxID=2017485 RepID=A0A220UAV1_9MICO|nr:hypothetical protein CFK39_04945 [Brachybacterium avium]